MTLYGKVHCSNRTQPKMQHDRETFSVPWCIEIVLYKRVFSVGIPFMCTSLEEVNLMS